jgi:DNA-binding transcriptional LysR family regulator
MLATMPEVDLNRIAVFVQVAESGSFTAAARRLRIPVSSVSRAIALLEEQIGVRLLHRTTRKLSLTDAGRSYHQRMQAVLVEAHDATQAIASASSELRGTVRISAPVGLGRLHLPRVVASILQRHPGLGIELMLTGRRVDMLEEGVDLSVGFGVLKDSSLMARKLADNELGVFGAPAYVERRGRPRRPADLAQHDCLHFGNREGKHAWRLEGPNGPELVEVTGSVACDDMSFLSEVVLAGVGLGLLPIGMMARETRAGSMLHVLPRYRASAGSMYLMWPSQKLLPAKVVAVRDLLIAELSRLPT